MARLTQKRANELLDYNPCTGILTWKKSNSNVVRVGDVAGCLAKKENRVVIGIDGERHWAHRVIYLMISGAMPEEVDHINGNSSDNRWVNLRSVSHRENMINRKVCSNNTSGIMGVYWNRHNSNWRARIKVIDKTIEIGSFKDFFEACCARKSAENNCGFHANHGRVAP